MLARKQNRTGIRFLFLLSVFCFSVRAQAPLQTENPYSRYGIGEIEQKGFAPLAAMGKAYTAFENDTNAYVFFINPGNPASYSSLRLTSFEAGGKSNFNFLQTSSEKVKSNNTYFSYLSLGFPLGKKGGLAAGITPYSTVGYKIVDSYSVSGIGDMKTEYVGSGGINQVFLGVGYKPFKNSYTHFRKSYLYDSLARAGRWNTIKRKRVLKSFLSSISLGANGYFMFGDLDQTTDVIYPSNVTYFNTRRIRNTRISDFYGSYGVLFTVKMDSSLNKRKCVIDDTSKAGSHIEYLNDCPCKSTMSKEDYDKNFPKKYQRASKKSTRITFGATAYLPTNLAANYTAQAFTYKKYSATQDFFFDTTLNVSRSGNIRMPLMLSYGIGIKRGNNLTILGDVNIQNWSFYRYFGENTRLKNSMRVSLGFQYTNNSELKVDKEIMAKRSFLRGGIYYQQSYLDLKSSKINEYGLTVGTGLPLGRRVFNHLNVSADFGTWGTTANNLIKNNYIRLTVGLTLNDRWFVKRVID